MILRYRNTFYQSEVNAAGIECFACENKMTIHSVVMIVGEQFFSRRTLAKYDEKFSHS